MSFGDSDLTCLYKFHRKGEEVALFIGPPGLLDGVEPFYLDGTVLLTRHLQKLVDTHKPAVAWAYGLLTVRGPGGTLQLSVDDGSCESI